MTTLLGPVPSVVSLTHGRLKAFTEFAGTLSVRTVLPPLVTVIVAVCPVVFDTETAKLSFGAVL